MPNRGKVSGIFHTGTDMGLYLRDKKVFSIEYLTQSSLIDQFIGKASENNFIPYPIEFSVKKRMFPANRYHRKEVKK